MTYDVFANRPKVHEINPQVIERLNKKILDKRNGKPPSNGPIDKIPKYDWAKDPRGYKDANGHVPYNRCYHCGFQYAMATGFTAFCNICTKALKYTQDGVLTKEEAARIRVPDEKKAVDMIKGNRL